ncbi:unnamed protein product [Rotaria sordida]|nr:unnamed protein product [Rotaria sordida]CAF1236548.1 unnamed protein product [Rotaria sordida]CAF1298975.1 unnamed protein product [Rotaria sordida]CAF1491998.1 unnamed protein product [Rotaria sordida]CAF3960369.1 unnamed protein product [Rotaria sordida]
MCHLPRKHEVTFQLIKDIFNIIFSGNSKVYIWGTEDELFPFTMYNLFSEEQIISKNFINLQHTFQQTWQQQHPHRSTSLSDTHTQCLCKECIGKKATETWSLQDAVAYTLHEWLNKRLTISSFHIGLDPLLFQMNIHEKEDRRKLTQYAIYDCLSMQRILIKLDLVKKQNKILPAISTTTINNSTSTTIYNNNNITDLEKISSDDNEPDKLVQQSTRTISTITTSIKETTYNNSNQIEFISSDDEDHEFQREQQPTPIVSNNSPANNKEQYNPLNKEQRKKIHNRTCTLKQRKKYYRHKIIKHNIDHRFTITNIKTILRQYSIQFCAINTVKPSRTNQTTLYIGIKNEKLLSTYEEKLKHLFTREHYQQYKHIHRSSNKDDRYIHHYHDPRTN